MRHRIEKDSLGDVRVSATAYWGAQTQRAIENFPISGQRMPRRFIQALGIVKRACAFTNEELGLLPVHVAEWVGAAAQEVADGEWDAQFPVDVFQTGSGTSTNMNANEVIANRAIELMGGVIGSRDPVHPNDHVNMSQSSNDVIPTVLHVAAAVAIHEDLLPALRYLRGSLAAKAEAFDDVVKTGRTHLMDATPVRLGQEFAGWARQVELGIARAARARDALLELALGGTATGTGLNCPLAFPRKAIARISVDTGLPFVEAADHFEAQGAVDAVVEASGLLRTVAVSLVKIANDVRLLASGPRAGLAELQLPATQPGSSIMPGKVNPVMCEMLAMVGWQVIGNDTVVTLGAQGGSLELNTALPLLADNLLRSVALLANGSRTFAARAIDGIQADRERCAATLERNLALATALAPTLGYDKAAEIAKAAARTGGTVREAAAGALPQAELDALLDPAVMTRPGSTTPVA
ncbi:MAG: class II fumarate hydratase [Pseudomonadota bacterium]|nr:class II fumarate hydratase [Pseudomonadota bacterium]